jgi:hypothetical protein
MKQNHPSGLFWSNLKATVLRDPFSEIFGKANKDSKRTISGN